MDRGAEHPKTTIPPSYSKVSLRGNDVDSAHGNDVGECGHAERRPAK